MRRVMTGTPSRPGHFAGTGPARHLRQPDPLQMFPVGALLPELVTAAVQRQLPADQPSRLYLSQRLRRLQPTAEHVSRLIVHTQLTLAGCVHGQATSYCVVYVWEMTRRCLHSTAGRRLFCCCAQCCGAVVTTQLQSFR